MKDLVLNGLFSPEELAIFSNLLPEGVDIDGLKKLGTVIVEDVQNKHGTITKTIKFETFDKTLSFVKEHTFAKYKANITKVEDLIKLMNLAANEDTVDGYKRAAKIKNTLDTLLLTI